MIFKKPTAFTEYGVVSREAGWLSLLSDWPQFPDFLGIVGSWILMSDCGDPLTAENLPDDWELQAEGILSALEEAGCRHNDIRPDNLTVKDGQIRLIDFGWATGRDETIPPTWPKALGGRFRKGEHDFDDRYSLEKSLEAIRQSPA